MELLGLYHYWVFAILLMIGFYAVISRGNLIKKLLGLSIFQSAVCSTLPAAVRMCRAQVSGVLWVIGSQSRLKGPRVRWLPG